MESKNLESFSVPEDENLAKQTIKIRDSSVNRNGYNFKKHTNKEDS